MLAITRLGLRGVEGMSRSVVTTAKHADKLVYSWVYTEAAVHVVLGDLRRDR